MTAGQALPELGSVPWRARTDARWLRRWQRIWHAWTLLYTVPFVAAAVGMLWLDPITAPVALVAAAHAWIIPELYAARGATVAPPEGAAPRACRAGRAGPARRPARPRRARAAASDRAGAASAASWASGSSARPAPCWSRPGGRCVHCFCVRATDARAAAVGPRRAPAAGAARGRGGLRDGGQPRLRGRALAGAPAPARPACVPRSTRGAGRHGASQSGALASATVAYDVVIAGGGFGGLYAARRLERRLPRHSARILLVSDVNFLLYTPLLPGAAAGSLEPRHVVVPLREELEWADIRLGRVTGADPARDELQHRHRGRPRRDAPLRPADRHARVGLARAARARPRGARARLQDARGRDRAAQPRAAEPRDRRVAARRRGPARVPDLRVRRGRLRRAGGHRRAAGLRGRRDRPLPALPASTARASCSSRRGSG